MFLALIPCHNEEKNIAEVIKKLHPFVDEVVVIDDSSEDETAAIAKKAGAIVIRHGINRGQGAALETGHCYAREIGADYVIHFDGDGQHDVNDITGAFKKITEENADILFGSRFLSNQTGMPWSKKYIILPIARVVDRLFSRIKLSDSHYGFRIISKKALDMINITQDRMAHASEILYFVRKCNLKWIEYPAHVQYKKYGQSINGGWQILYDLIVGKFIK